MTNDLQGNDSIAILKCLLDDTGFAGFSFSTSFSLRFERNHPGTFRGNALPWAVELRLDAPWWIGDHDKWEQRIEKEAPLEAPSPEEPLQAFELAKLRWSEGADVSSVECDPKTLKIVFENRTELFVDLEEADSFWEIVEYGVCEIDSRWSVTWEGATLSSRSPEYGMGEDVNKN